MSTGISGKNVHQLGSQRHHLAGTHHYPLAGSQKFGQASWPEDSQRPVQELFQQLRERKALASILCA